MFLENIHTTMAYTTAQFFKGLDIETAEIVAFHICKSKKGEQIIQNSPQQNMHL